MDPIKLTVTEDTTPDVVQPVATDTAPDAPQAPVDEVVIAPVIETPAVEDTNVVETVKAEAYTYRGSVILSDTTRTVEGKEVRHITCGDGCQYDITPEEALQIKLA